MFFTLHPYTTLGSKKASRSTRTTVKEVDSVEASGSGVGEDPAAGSHATNPKQKNLRVAFEGVDIDDRLNSFRSGVGDHEDDLHYRAYRLEDFAQQFAKGKPAFPRSARRASIGKTVKCKYGGEITAKVLSADKGNQGAGIRRKKWRSCELGGFWSYRGKVFVFEMVMPLLRGKYIKRAGHVRGAIIG